MSTKLYSIVFVYTPATKKSFAEVSQRDFEDNVIRIFEGKHRRGETLLPNRGLDNYCVLKGRISSKNKEFRFVTIIQRNELYVLPILIAAKNTRVGKNVLPKKSLYADAMQILEMFRADQYEYRIREVHLEKVSLPNNS